MTGESESVDRSVDTVRRGDVRHLALVPEPAHDHLWALRDTEFDDSGIVLRRFECTCGAVTYT